MTDMERLRTVAAASRAAAAGDHAMTVPHDRPERAPTSFASQLRSKKVERDGMQWYRVEGYATVFEKGYEMWDFFGPYTEIVSAGAADRTLDANPEVVFRLNHAGLPMASTGNNRLELWADENGLGDRALLNPKRADVQELIHALDDDDIREQSFTFRITDGQWSPDYMEYRINSFDLDRGDVGPVTYGANPYTSIASRSGELLRAIPVMPSLLAREAYTMLRQRHDLAESPETVPANTGPIPPAEPSEQGRSIALIRTRLLVSNDED